MVLSVSDVRAIVTKVCARTDVLDACRKRDLGTVIAVLGAHGVTQGQISGLTGIPQGRLSEYMTRKRDSARLLDLPGIRRWPGHALGRA